jgi:glycosyltransferase involved in cell wall biosynthesis
VTEEAAKTASLDGRKVLMLVENLSVPFDRRVWAECRSLAAAGCRVTVICPRGVERDLDQFEERDGVVIHRFRARPADGGAVGYAVEYAVALTQMWRLVRHLSRETSFDIVHAANPPDLLLLTAHRLKRRGARFIFDHHDLAPELYQSRFGRDRDLVFRALKASERLAFRLADVVISTNESYRELAVTRGGKRPEDVFVVRNGPDSNRFTGRRPDPALKGGKRYLIAYVGMMGPQDGLDHAVRALVALKRDRSDWRAVFVGDGDAAPAARDSARATGIADDLDFLGLVDEERVLQVLSTADVCLAPEPSTPLNDVSTMIKVAEYMALSRPVVAFDLRETRATAGDAALYAPPNDDEAYAELISVLLDDEQKRLELGTRARERFERELTWQQSAQQLLAAYDRALGVVRDGAASPGQKEAQAA